MTALYVLVGIVLFFLWLFTRKLVLNVSYCRYENKPGLAVRFLFLKFNYFLELSKKGEAKEEDELDEAVKRAKKKRKEQQREEKKSEGKVSIKEVLRIVKASVSEIYRKFGKYLFLEKFDLRLNVATEDAASTALLYGGVSALCAPLYAFTTRIKRKKKDCVFMEVKPDFYAASIDAAVNITVSIRLWQVVSCLITASKAYLKFSALKKGNKKDEPNSSTKENTQ